jgi:hypothetical protein
LNLKKLRLYPRDETNLHYQWPMVAIIGIIFAFLPESPWWLVSKGKIDKASKVLKFCNGGIADYDMQEHIVGLPLNSMWTALGRPKNSC